MKRHCNCPADGSRYCAWCQTLAQRAGIVLQHIEKVADYAMIEGGKARCRGAETPATTLTTKSVLETAMATVNLSTPPVRIHKKPASPRIKRPKTSIEDRRYKRAMLEAMGQQPPEVVFNLETYPTRIAHNRIVAHCVVPGNPGVKQRPRFVMASGKVYSPKPMKESQQEIGWAVRVSMRELLLDEFAAFGLRLVFYVIGAHRKDIDNMAKLVFDGVTGVTWKDDSQVKELMSWVVIDEVHPRTEIMIYKLGYNAVEYRLCLICNTPFQIYPSWFGRPYCSRKCASFAQRNRIVMTCIHCGKTMERIPAESTKYREYFCSRECKRLHHTIELLCGYCGKTFRRGQANVRHKQNTYCSRPCMENSRKLTTSSLTFLHDVHALNQEGLSRTAVARQLGIGTLTVKRLLETPIL